LAVFLAACGPTSQATPSANRARPALVLTKSDFGMTVQVRVGQTFEVDLAGWTLFSPPPGVVQRIAAASPVSGRTTFKAIGSGSQLFTAVQDVPRASCKDGCAELAPRYGHFVVVVVPADQVFDLALSEIDTGRIFLLKPGQRIVAAIPNAALVESDAAVVVPDPVRSDNSLSMLTAQRPGRAELSAAGFRVTLLVKPAASPYDVVASERDGGRTIPASVGQVIVFRLKNGAGFLPWRGGSGALASVVDQAAPRDPNATTFTYLVPSAGKVLLRFEDDPSCLDKPTCADIGRMLSVSLEVGP
jgi:hypothetical protein